MAVQPEPAPTGSGNVVLSQLLTDIQSRAEWGKEKYGTYLRAHNGRDALIDAYQESMDQSMYLCQAVMEAQDSEVYLCMLLEAIRLWIEYNEKDNTGCADRLLVKAYQEVKWGREGSSGMGFTQRDLEIAATDLERMWGK